MTRGSHCVRVAAGILVSLSGLVGSGCSRQESESQQTIRVFAASSLTEAFTQIEGEFEQRFPHLDVKLVFGGSHVLRMQIEQGAPADVFASANLRHVEELVRSQQAGQPQLFAYNELAIAVPIGNPAGIESERSLNKATRLVVGHHDSPIGQYTKDFVSSLGRAYGPEFAASLDESIVSYESNTRLVRAKVELGEADAAIVYASDLKGATGVESVPIRSGANIRAEYMQVATTATAHSKVAATVWMEFVSSETGQGTLLKHGFSRIPQGAHGS